MKKIIVGIVFCLAMFFPPEVKATKIAVASASLRGLPGKNQEEDERYLLLASFLWNHNSPLASEARTFVEAADKWQLDWRLLPAITGLESAFGKRLVKGSFNPFGWAGGYYYFDSWKNGIEHVAQYLKENYYDRGKDTPQKIGPVYAPPNPRWGILVSSLMEEISPSSN